MPIKAVIFDLGRVLIGIDTNGEKFRKLLEQAGISLQEVFKVFWQHDFTVQHMLGKINSVQFYQEACKYYKLTISYEKFVDAWCDIFYYMPETNLIFEQLQNIMPVGILSDTDPLHWEKVSNMLPQLKKVSKPTLSFQVGYKKPNPNIYFLASENMGLKVESCLFIDDMPENVQGAIDSGMSAILYTSPKKLQKDLLEYGIVIAKK